MLELKISLLGEIGIYPYPAVLWLSVRPPPPPSFSVYLCASLPYDKTLSNNGRDEAAHNLRFCQTQIIKYKQIAIFHQSFQYTPKISLILLN